MIAFSIHIAILINTLLNIIDNIAEGGLGNCLIILGILYSILFMFLFNPLILFLFYRCTFCFVSGYAGLCKDKSKLSLFIYIQPLAIIVEIVISIVDFLGFNGFVRVAK